MSPFHVVKTKIRKVGGGNVNSCLELFISGRFALERPLDIQVDFVEGKEWEGFSVGAVIRFCLSLFSWFRQMAGNMCEPQQDFTW